MSSAENQHERIVRFIELLKGPALEGGNDAHAIMEEINMNGNCYNFAKALQLAFPEIELYSVSYEGKNEVSHVVAKLGSRYYDIRGEIDMNQQNYTWWHKITEAEEQFSCQYVYSFPQRNAVKINETS